MARRGLNRRLLLKDVGEDEVVRRLSALLPGRPDLILPPGDDCAAVDTGGEDFLLLKTDCVVEGIHYAPGENPRSVGHKALARALSDVAAMGGTPQHALITILTPASTPLAYWEEVYRGMAATARAAAVAVAGGETSSAPHRAIVVALTGTVRRKNLRTRSGARAGDVLFVTGRLGGSLRTGHHLSFQPRLVEGQWLASRTAVRAMMDLSDGLAADLPRLAAASGTGWVVDESALPLTPGCTSRDALRDGEDYELLIAVEPSAAGRLMKSWKARFPRVLLTPVGELTAPPISPSPHPSEGFDHFRIASGTASG